MRPPVAEILPTLVTAVLPIQEHPTKREIWEIYRTAKQQARAMYCSFHDSNLKARIVRENLTAEMLYVYEFVEYVYTILAVPPETFARQVGIKVQTLNIWLGKNGHFPSKTAFRRLLAVYEMNFLDFYAKNILHKPRIEQWNIDHQERIDRQKWEIAKKLAKEQENAQ